MKLWVDDMRKPPSQDWLWARSYKAAITLLKEQNWNFEIISLDHDLGRGRTGYDVLCFIEEHFYYVGCKPPLIGIHTSNPVGRQRMMQIAQNLNTRTIHY